MEFVALAGDLGVAVIVEGIATVKQSAHLRELGIERSRGYHQSASVNAEQLASLLGAGPASSARSGLPPTEVDGGPA